ncbi:type IV secretion system protein [Nocardioides sp. NPDC087217]|uniref:type IV secretion system protein n=1 Tax=Nocardioides sp. NPDC087217 TaxID=3364335 RepID=UPI0037F90DEC
MSGAPTIAWNPLEWAGDASKEILADGFTSMMMSVWSAAMWLLEAAFKILDAFVTVNVTDPDLARLYSVTLWVSLAIALIIGFGQIGLAVVRQDGRGFGQLIAGLIQYGAVVVCWVAVCGAIIAACAGLTHGILYTLLDVNDFSGYTADDGFVDTVSGTVDSAVLGITALFVLIPASFGYLIIMLVRAAALLILTATIPITAAGALSEGTRSWMWKSIRWFLAAALMSPLLALVLGIGVQLAHAGFPDAASGTGETLQGSTATANIGMSVVGAVILIVGCFMPLALFRLLAFVDPGTASGASFRSTMAANGGAAGLFSKAGGGLSGAAGSGAATQTESDGRTASEAGAEAETANNFQSYGAKSLGGKIGGVGGWGLSKVGAGMAATGRVAQYGASVSVDTLGQAGVGSQSHYGAGSTQARPGRKRHRRGGSGDAREPSGSPDLKADTGGVTNDVPPQVAEAAEDGAFLV